MNWKIKALGQKFVAALPETVSYQMYDILQKRLGKMNAKRVNPTRLIERTGLILSQIRQQGQPITDATFLEVGTGWKWTTPMCLWLCGAKKIITVDLNPYLRPDLVELEAEYICQNSDSVIQVLADVAEIECLNDRMAQLQSQIDLSCRSLSDLMNIEYLAPADAAHLPQVETIDYHISHTVFEHIPELALRSILKEAHRMLRGDGLCVHFIDPSDHFAHRDKNISEVNFLQFSERQWKFWANNRYAYHNRLRVDDYEALFFQAKLSVIHRVIECDSRSMETLASGLSLATPFIEKSQEINAATKLLITAQK